MPAKRSRTAIVAGSAAFALLGAGCATTSGDGAEQTFRFAPANFPPALDAHYYATELGVYNVAYQILDPLVILEEGEIKPALAESWEATDELTWVFNLREAQFSDGTTLTADDVKASLERILDLNGPIAPVFSEVDSISADDDRTLTITTTEPVGTLLNSLSLVFVGKADSVDDESYWQSPIGTGPFVVEEYVVDDRLELSRNEHYWGEAPALDRVEVVNMPEISARMTALEVGEIDAITEVPPDQAASLEELDDVTYTTDDSFMYLVAWFNHNSDGLDDVRVRQALTYAVDLQGIVNDLYGDAAAVMNGPLTPAVFGAPSLEPHLYDPERAEELLAEAGYADGLTLEMIWPNDAAPNVRSFAQAMISHWAEVGVTVEPFDLERAAWTDRFDGGDYDLSLFENVTTTGDADYTLNRLYTCEADRMGYCDSEVDQYLSQAATTIDAEERERLYAEASRILWDDAVSLWAMEMRNSAGVREEVQGFSMKPTSLVDFAMISRAQG